MTLLLLACGTQHLHAQSDGTGTEETHTRTRSTSNEEQPDGRQSSPLDRGRGSAVVMATSNGCEDGCEVCHDRHCFECSPGYQRINYSCEKKGCTDPRCVDCSSNVCYKCVEGFAPNLDGFCTWIGPTGCQEKNCMLCEETRIGCTECMPGYQLRSNRCFKKACADKNCMRCTSDGKECQLCQEGYQSRLGECLKVGCLDNHCRQCSPSGGSCYRCDDGYYDDIITGTCKTCPDPNCLNCNGSQNSCIKCMEGFFVGRLPSGRVGCVECGEAVDHCMTCNRDGNDCYSCSSGYYLEHGHCIACPADCDRCKSPWFCDSCKLGFDLYANGLCQIGQNASLASSDAQNHSPNLILLFTGLVHLILALFCL